MRTLRISLTLVLLAVIVGPVIGAPDDEVANLVIQLKDPKNKNPFARENIAREIGKRAAMSKAAVPALLEMIKEPADIRPALLGLTEAGPAAKEAMPPLLAILKDQDKEKVKHHQHVLDVIGHIKPTDVKELLEILTPLIADEEGAGKTFEAEFARRRAIEVLGQVGPDAKAVAPTLYPLLKNEKFLRRPGYNIATVKAVGLMQPDPKDALPAITPFLSHMDRTMAREAAKAYLRVVVEPDDNSKAISDGMVAAFRDQKNGGVRGEAVADLEDLGPKAKFAIPALIDDIEGKNGFDRTTGLRILTKMGPETKEALPALLKAAANKEIWPNSFGSLMDAIPKLGGTKKDQLHLCIAILEDYVAADGKYHPQKGQFPQRFQGDALGKIREMGPEGAAAAPVVTKIVEYHLVVVDGGQSFIIQAMQTLHGMGGGARVALPTLQKAALNGGYKFTAEEAIKGILTAPVVVKPKDPMDKPKDPMDKPKDPMMAVKTAPNEKLAPLLADLKDPTPEKRRKAVLELAALGAGAKDAVPMLTEMLRDKDRETSILAGYALEKILTAR